ncbi:hypothetical protein DPMN_147452 [Dreissena polymorpha]|uniref:Uncharacterized protein n=1 Tax=Dreissena polymorpha TaxID=45954 RepID=A0A9D4IZC1_DREPO|nr:hypothetical protein DPMN_147452 [Dreissena polymorpha]
MLQGGLQTEEAKHTERSQSFSKKARSFKDGQNPSFIGFKTAAHAKREVELHKKKLLKAKCEIGLDIFHA